jgi:hypothetical protein
VSLAAGVGENRAENAGRSIPERAVTKKAARRPPFKQSRFKGLEVVVGPNQGGKLVQRICPYRDVIGIPGRRGIAIPHGNIDGDILETHKPDAGFDDQGDVQGTIAIIRGELTGIINR